MSNEKIMTEQESLQLITNMIQKAKSSYHDRGTGAILWGTVVSIVSFVTYLQNEYDFPLPVDIWLLTMVAFIPQIYISIKEGKEKKVQKFEDAALNAVWVVFGITIFGIVLYQNIVPSASLTLINAEGWELVKHFKDGKTPDEIIRPFIPSSHSLFILIYAFPTLVTGLVKRFAPMTFGAIITYVLFIFSCFTHSKYDFLFAAFAAIVCWLIPGFILRNRYIKSKALNV